MISRLQPCKTVSLCLKKTLNSMEFFMYYCTYKFHHFEHILESQSIQQLCAPLSNS